MIYLYIPRNMVTESIVPSQQRSKPLVEANSLMETFGGGGSGARGGVRVEGL